MYHPDECGDDRLTGFADELARIVGDTALPVNILLSIREDAWAKLDRFEGHIPAVRQLPPRRPPRPGRCAGRRSRGRSSPGTTRSSRASRGSRSSRRSSRRCLPPRLGGLTLTADSESPLAEAAGDRVEAPFLQLVLDRLWHDAVAAGGHTRSPSPGSRRSGAPAGSSRTTSWTHSAVSPPRSRTSPPDCARFLVSRSKTKIAYTATDLAEWTGRPEAQVTAVLVKLCSGESGRILRAIAPARTTGARATSSSTTSSPSRSSPGAAGTSRSAPTGWRSGGTSASAASCSRSSPSSPHSASGRSCNGARRSLRRTTPEGLRTRRPRSSSHPPRASRWHPLRRGVAAGPRGLPA